jgi:hypothetical protein
MWACFKGHGAAVRTLLYGGANRDLRNTVTLAFVVTVTTTDKNPLCGATLLLEN